MRKARFTELQIIVVLKSVEAGRTVKSVCREAGISEVSYSSWKVKHGGMEATEIKKMIRLPGPKTALLALFSMSIITSNKRGYARKAPKDKPPAGKIFTSCVNEIICPPHPNKKPLLQNYCFILLNQISTKKSLRLNKKNCADNWKLSRQFYYISALIPVRQKSLPGQIMI